MATSLISFEEARRRLFELGRELGCVGGAEEVPLQDCLGRVLAHTVHAPFSVPRFDQAAMDGFALRSEDTISASSTHPVRFRCVGNCAAGDPIETIRGSGETVRIMTGARVPVNADAVLEREEVDDQGSEVVISHFVPRGLNIRERGEDLLPGDPALLGGLRLHPASLAVAAALGISTLGVTRRPRLSVVVTGQELVEAGSSVSDVTVFDSNSSFLRGALDELGFQSTHYERVSDDPMQLRRSLTRSLGESDVVILTGGVSVGDHDFTRPVLKEMGAEEIFWGVAQKPGKPLYLGRFGRTPVLGLPGNPYAVFVCFHLFVRPLLLTLMGDGDPDLPSARLPVVFGDARIRGQRTMFLKGRRIHERYPLMVEVLPKQGSHLLSPLVGADALIQLEPNEDAEEAKTYFLPR